MQSFFHQQLFSTNSLISLHSHIHQSAKQANARTSLMFHVMFTAQAECLRDRPYCLLNKNTILFTDFSETRSYLMRGKYVLIFHQKSVG